MLPGVVHQDPAHGARGDPEEVPPVLPVDAGEVHQLDVGLVYQAGRPQRMARALALQVVVGDPAQVRVDRGVQPVGRGRVAFAELEQEVGDLVRLAHRVGCGCGRREGATRPRPKMGLAPGSRNRGGRWGPDRPAGMSGLPQPSRVGQWDHLSLTQLETPLRELGSACASEHRSASDVGIGFVLALPEFHSHLRWRSYG